MDQKSKWKHYNYKIFKRKYGTKSSWTSQWLLGYNTKSISDKRKKKKTGDSLGGSVVKKPPSNAGDIGFILVGELRSHMP